MRLVTLLVLMALLGCAGPPAAQQTIAPPTASLPGSTPTQQPRATTSPTTTSLPGATALPSPLPLPRVCTPLQGYPLDALTKMTANPYAPPAPGSDDPHHGVDLAVVLPDTNIAVTGHPVQAVLAGIVAAVIRDRFPYGNAILIETPLDTQPEEWWQPLALAAPAPTPQPNSALTCPAGTPYQPPDPKRRSLYLLYAHLAEAPGLAVESSVDCGQQIGLVGQSGNALAPHLHFEARTGPASLRFDSMAHYDASASVDEMRNYCLWRVSGLFALLDPNRIFTLER